MAHLSQTELLALFKAWLAAWDAHDLGGVMAPMHDAVMFENWTGATVTGKRALRRAWAPWFQNHGGFRFSEEDVFVDVAAQKLLFRWCLAWPSPDATTHGHTELRRGVDVLHFVDGKIHRKYSYSKTTTTITVTQDTRGSLT
jgi:hypothetical protein